VEHWRRSRGLGGFSIQRKEPPRQVRRNKKLLQGYQRHLQAEGVELEWPRLTPR
jgi:hypothetical protein